jgi:predicted DCC family thiol-disulfide oxidoreductase YuxK
VIEVGKKIQVLFDGDCGICARGCEILVKIDRRNLFEYTPYQSHSEEELRRFGADYEICNKKILVITLKGKSLFGAFGLNRLLWQYFPYNVGVFLIYAVPIFLVFELIAYKIVASNRAKISGFFGLRVCALPPQKRSER